MSRTSMKERVVVYVERCPEGIYRDYLVASEGKYHGKLFMCHPYVESVLGINATKLKVTLTNVKRKTGPGVCEFRSKTTSVGLVLGAVRFTNMVEHRKMMQYDKWFAYDSLVLMLEGLTEGRKNKFFHIGIEAVEGCGMEENLNTSMRVTTCHRNRAR